MGADQIKKASLWREGAKSFQTHWREWLFIALVFFFILAAFYGISSEYMEPIQSKLRELKGQKDATRDYLLSVAPTLGIMGAVMLVLVYVEHYLFFSFFMGKEMPGASRKASVGGFFCFFGINIVVWFLIVIPFTAGIGVSIGLVKISRVLFVIGLIVSFALMFFMAFRFYLAIPLASARIKSSLKTSWALTRDNFWRLFGNTCMIMLIILGIYVAFIIASAIFGFVVGIIGAFGAQGHMDAIKGIVSIFVKSVVGGGMGVLTAGLVCSYASAVCRILYEEKRAAGPNFILTTSA